MREAFIARHTLVFLTLGTDSAAGTTKESAKRYEKTGRIARPSGRLGLFSPYGGFGEVSSRDELAPEGSEQETLQEQADGKRTDGLSGGGFPRIAQVLTFSWLWIIPFVCIFGVLIILIYSIQLPSGVRWSVFCVGVVIGSAAFLIGGLVGFLFGIPRTVQSSIPSTGATQYQGNTNLEQVSDWLTKIIVGVSLVEIGRILPALAKLAEILKAPLGGRPSSAAFGVSMVIACVLTGFFFIYLWTREMFVRELGVDSASQQSHPERATGHTDSSSSNSEPIT